jgi:hypothetical protein
MKLNNIDSERVTITELLWGKQNALEFKESMNLMVIDLIFGTDIVYMED